MWFNQTNPKKWDALKEAVFAGQVFVLPPSTASHAIADHINAAFEYRNGFPFTSDLHDHASFYDGLELVNRVRADVMPLEVLMPLIGDVLREFDGVEGDAIIGDVLRLRMMMDRAHKNGMYPHSYAAHRDCWYANPQAQINMWIPLADVTKGNSFAFFPQYFDAPIKNGSSRFDYDHFCRFAGFQTGGAVDQSLYPVAEGSLDDQSHFAFEAPKGARVIFAASHLHQSVLNESGLSRFSVDFRVVSMHDIADGRGAPNSDNQSTGQAERDYHRVI